VACVALAMMATAPVVTWIVLSPPAAHSVAASFAAPLSDSATSAFRSAPVWLPDGVPRGRGAPLLPWVLPYAEGSSGVLRADAWGWILAERLRSRLVRRASGDCSRLSIAQDSPSRLATVQCLVSSLVQAPMVVDGSVGGACAVGAFAGCPQIRSKRYCSTSWPTSAAMTYLVNFYKACRGHPLSTIRNLVGFWTHSRGARTLLRRHGCGGKRRCSHVRARAGGLESARLPTWEWSWRRAADLS